MNRTTRAILVILGIIFAALAIGVLFSRDAESAGGRPWKKYVWGAGITTPHAGEIQITSAAKLLRYNPDAVVWTSAGTCATLRDAPDTAFVDEPSREFARTRRNLFTTGAFMRIGANTIVSEQAKWDRCHVGMVVWNPESAWQPGYLELKRYTRGESEFVCGNVGWGRVATASGSCGYADRAAVADLRLFGDALECYYRGFGPGRTALDYLCITAFLAEIGKPYYMLPNAWSDSARAAMPLADYDRAMRICEEAPGCAGVGAWAWDSLPDELVARWNASAPRAVRVPRWQITLTANASPDNRVDVAKFRIAWYAGQVCAARLPFEEARLPLLDDYFDRQMLEHVNIFYAGQISAAQCEAVERAAAARLLERVTR